MGGGYTQDPHCIPRPLVWLVLLQNHIFPPLTWKSDRVISYRELAIQLENISE